MLMPKRVKYRRPHKVSYEGKAKGNTELSYGDFGLQIDKLRLLVFA